MTANEISGASRSLRQQVAGLENQIVRRRQKVRSTVPEIRRKVTAQMSSPVALLAAVGIGVAVEQASRRGGWSFATVLNAVNASLGLVQSFSSSMQGTGGPVGGSRP